MSLCPTLIRYLLISRMTDTVNGVLIFSDGGKVNIIRLGFYSLLVL